MDVTIKCSGVLNSASGSCIYIMITDDNINYSIDAVEWIYSPAFPNGLIIRDITDIRFVKINESHIKVQYTTVYGKMGSFDIKYSMINETIKWIRDLNKHEIDKYPTKCPMINVIKKEK